VDLINQAIVDGDALRDLGKEFHCSEDALWRHKQSHISKHVQPVHPAPVMVHSILAELASMRERARDVEDEALLNGDPNLILKAIREEARIIESLIKLASLVSDRDIAMRKEIVRLEKNPEWIALRYKLGMALKPYPEAFKAVKEVLRESGN